MPLSLSMSFDMLPDEDGDHVYEVTAPWLDAPIYATTFYAAYWLAVAAKPRP